MKGCIKMEAMLGEKIVQMVEIWRDRNGKIWRLNGYMVRENDIIGS